MPGSKASDMLHPNTAGSILYDRAVAMLEHASFQRTNLMRRSIFEQAPGSVLERHKRFGAVPFLSACKSLPSKVSGTQILGRHVEPEHRKELAIVQPNVTKDPSITEEFFRTAGTPLMRSANQENTGNTREPVTAVHSTLAPEQALQKSVASSQESSISFAAPARADSFPGSAPASGSSVARWAQEIPAQVHTKPASRDERSQPSPEEVQPLLKEEVLAPFSETHFLDRTGAAAATDFTKLTDADRVETTTVQPGHAQILGPPIFRVSKAARPPQSELEGSAAHPGNTQKFSSSMETASSTETRRSESLNAKSPDIASIASSVNETFGVKARETSTGERQYSASAELTPIDSPPQPYPPITPFLPSHNRSINTMWLSRAQHSYSVPKRLLQVHLSPTAQMAGSRHMNLIQRAAEQNAVATFLRRQVPVAGPVANRQPSSLFGSYEGTAILPQALNSPSRIRALPMPGTTAALPVAAFGQGQFESSRVSSQHPAIFLQRHSGLSRSSSPKFGNFPTPERLASLSSAPSITNIAQRQVGSSTGSSHYPGMFLHRSPAALPASASAQLSSAASPQATDSEPVTTSYAGTDRAQAERAAMAQIDVPKLADQVYQLLVRRLASERERRGL
ncbi:MAG: hypothetical protein JOY62_01170 [Acidobacteriaceae bacterium]|nr:hypothetical protein [Acidobacteriaceae bacterium]